MQGAKPGVSGDFCTSRVRAAETSGTDPASPGDRAGGVVQHRLQPEGEHAPSSMANYFLRCP